MPGWPKTKALWSAPLYLPPMKYVLKRLLALLLLLFVAGQPLHAQQLFLKQFGAAEGLNQPFVYALTQDQTGYLWLATAEGVVRYDGTAFRTFTTRDNLAENFVTGFYLAPAGGPLWVRHFQGGISRWDGEQFQSGRAIENVPPAFAHPAGLPPADTAALKKLRTRFQLRLPAGIVITCALPDREGSLWLGTAGQGLWRLTDPHISRRATQALPRSWAGTPATLTARQQAQLPTTAEVTCLTRAPDGSLWAGTVTDGAFQFADDGKLTNYSTANGLLHNTVYDVLADRQGRVWFASHGTGLAMWNQGRFHYFRLVPGAVSATALAQDAAGRVWVGTEGSGLWCFTNGHFQQFTARQGLGSDYCYALAPYPNGDLLVVHRQGLSRFDARRRTFSQLAAAANPLVRECQPRAAVVDAAGTAWVGTRGGVLRVYPAVLPTTAAPGLKLTRAEVDGARRDAARTGKLPAGQHQLGFAWQGISLAQAGAVQYQYRLRGYQEAWSRPVAVGEADFPRLDAGSYEFEGRARLGETGAWAAPVRAAFSIATPLWQRPWFIGLLGLAGLMGLGIVVRVREAALRRQQRQLEGTVQERTAELRAEKVRIEGLNADLTVARDAAEASRLAKSRFLANMSHEIRTPMNAVIGLTYLLQRMPTTEEQREYLEAIQGSSQNLLTIINDILDSSKIEAGKLTLEQVPFGLRELLGRVTRMFAFATTSKGLAFDLELNDEVPAAIYGDPVRLNQILVNLIGNAIKFTTHGGVTLRVGAELVAGPGQWQLRFDVQDTGIGIAADKLETIFEDFSQANTGTTRQFGGTGLGLSIARNLVELHGGQLHVESQVGEGSTFWFELPCQVADPALVPVEGPVELAPFRPPLRVLVAEDNELNQLVARKTLEAWNVRVTLAPNGRLAVEIAVQQEFDAVLMDVQMPEMDGYEATRQLRLHFPDSQQLPIIGLTASALPEDRALALEAGMNDTLPKPFDPAVLYATLARYTRRPAESPELAVKTELLVLPVPAPESTPAMPAADAEPPVELSVLVPDWSLLEELSFGNDDFVTQVIATFLREAPPLVAQLHHAASQHDAVGLAHALHKLRGQTAYFGIPTLQDDLNTLEQAAQRATPGFVAHAEVAALSQQLAALYPALRQRLPRRRTGH